MNDKHIVEIAFLGRLLYLIVIGGLHVKDSSKLLQLEEEALRVADESFEGLTAPHVLKLKRRVMRMDELTLRKESYNPTTERGAHAEKLVLAVYSFIENLVRQAYITMPADSGIAVLTDALLTLVDVESSLFEPRRQRAVKLANKWLELLQRNGYYAGVQSI